MYLAQKGHNTASGGFEAMTSLNSIRGRTHAEALPLSHRDLSYFVLMTD